RVDERRLVHWGGLLECAFQVGQGVDATAVVLPDPALPDLVDGRRVQVVQLLPAAAERRDEVRGLEHGEVLADGLPGHVELRAELAQGLAVAGVQAVQQPPAAGIGERPERVVHVRICSHLAAYNRQPLGCVSRTGGHDAWIRPSARATTAASAPAMPAAKVSRSTRAKVRPHPPEQRVPVGSEDGVEAASVAGGRLPADADRTAHRRVIGAAFNAGSDPERFGRGSVTAAVRGLTPPYGTRRAPGWPSSYSTGDEIRAPGRLAANGSFIRPGTTPNGRTTRPHEYSNSTMAPVYQAAHAPITNNHAPTLIHVGSPPQNPPHTNALPAPTVASTVNRGRFSRSAATAPSSVKSASGMNHTAKPCCGVVSGGMAMTCAAASACRNPQPIQYVPHMVSSAEPM